MPVTINGSQAQNLIEWERIRHRTVILMRGTKLAPACEAETAKIAKKLLVATVGGAVVGGLIGFYLIPDAPGMVYSILGGAFIGWVIAERVMGWTSWFTLSGAISGGLLGLLATGLGKGSLYGITVGGTAGLLLGLGLEAVKKKRNQG